MYVQILQRTRAFLADIARASSESKKDYVFASPMEPSPKSVSVEVLLSDRLELHLYQASVYVDLYMHV